MNTVIRIQKKVIYIKKLEGVKQQLLITIQIYNVYQYNTNVAIQLSYAWMLTHFAFTNKTDLFTF